MRRLDTVKEWCYNRIHKEHPLQNYEPVVLNPKYFQYLGHGGWYVTEHPNSWCFKMAHPGDTAQALADWNGGIILLHEDDWIVIEKEEDE